MVQTKPIRISKRGQYYQIDYYNLNGKRRRLSAGNNYQNTQRLVVKFTDWILEGKDPELELKKIQQNKVKESITLRELFPKFMERHDKHRSKKMQASNVVSKIFVDVQPLLMLRLI